MYIYIDEEYSELSDSDSDWCCIGYQADCDNQLTWEQVKGNEFILSQVKSAYLEIIKW